MRAGSGGVGKPFHFVNCKIQAALVHDLKEASLPEMGTSGRQKGCRIKEELELVHYRTVVLLRRQALARSVMLNLVMVPE